MKKAVWIILCCLLLPLLCCCRAEEQSDPAQPEPEIEYTRTVTFVNGVTEADVWLMPQTEANLKTSLWGTATASEVKTGESREVRLPEPGDTGCYIFRMIDVDQFYYSANDLVLEDGWTFRITMEENDLETLTVEVTDADGAVMGTYSVFAAML